MMEHLFESYVIRIACTHNALHALAYFTNSLVGICLLWPNRAARDTIVFVYYAVTGSSDPRVNTDKLQPASEDIFSITSSEISKFAYTC